MTNTNLTEGGFGPNIWLVDEMYRKFLDAPSSVSEAWQEFFADYSPGLTAHVPGTARPAAVAPTAPTPAQTARTAPEGPVADLPPGAAPMRGVSAKIAERMDDSLAVPTATSVRTIPAKLLEVNRRIINNQLARITLGGKVSFTHLIGWAVVRAIAEQPDMNVAYRVIDGNPYLIRHADVNLGLAIDVERKDGSRSLLVPNIRGADRMNFQEFWLAYEEMVHRVRANKITPEDFAGTTVSLTNPGTIGTVQSVPRLMDDHGLIVGVGAIAYPPEYSAANPSFLARMGIGRIITMTSTYDHRVIQGAQSGRFLARIHELLLGADGFYDEIFEAMGIPYTPARWAVDDNPQVGSAAWAEKQARVFQLINIYRVRGHLIADLDPLRQSPPALHPELDPLTYGLTIWDLDREFATGALLDKPVMKLGDILGSLRDAYCRTIGIEYMHIQEPVQKEWIQRRIEGTQPEMTRATKIRLLRKLNEAEAFERFLHTKYLGHKRFGLEGAESLIPLLDTVLNAAVDADMDEVVMAMAHRGRLNVLANTIGKEYARIFREFDDVDEAQTQGSGDVKYHLGSRGIHEVEDGRKLSVAVVANPSHLEAADPVLEGFVRAKQEQFGSTGHHKVLPVLIHGDAAFAGQGVVVETFNMSQLRGYRTGGTVHVVVNNQVGFTTSSLDARSSFYATDVAKTVQAPIIHVNGDDPEGVAKAAELAFAFRQEFHKDVVIDMICYRRRGHNEGDEPSYTQPLMYRIIDQRRSVRKLYMEKLVNTKEISVDEGEALLEEFRGLLDAAFASTRDLQGLPTSPEPAAAPSSPVDSSVDHRILDQIVTAVSTPPEGFTLHPKLVRLVENRRKMFEAGVVDWGLAEAFALGSMALDGIWVRLAGEDSKRGTFSHRHGSLVDYETGQEWIALQDLAHGHSRLRLVDSLLSEFGALGFEYGYSIGAPTAFTAWEAQFGDFVNGAQVIIDQFIIAGEDKWNQASGLVMLLPHGFEGQGPEHSSARIERFLQSCAGDNLRIVVPSTSTSYFHALRRQAVDPIRKPLVIFTPKSLLRTSSAFGSVEEITGGQFAPVIPDTGTDPSAVTRVVLCSGKVYHDLIEHQPAHVALVRVERMYPFPADELAAELGRYGDEVEVVWLQEEPANMGAWTFVRHRLSDLLGKEIGLIGRPESASPATGSHQQHDREQEGLRIQAFA
ncbi:MAG: multifunctional oxoglutarate decarboxylase/oxoglutarate dehydrogenase thiamine pyrophosphate-binding subunit/dihydrolipoyllysine-residue succinyltransferase subunit [Acidimicrobiia bacterium]|nr:multifunctional oxoglutarate decarboxylase/oxoglutarate dehydrogenase thiamine pyrophosphate-binding subunit/dihydrolipoyllysine-residue succinyltransferase subunit [Acidimicrobiia bacterium]